MRTIKTERLENGNLLVTIPIEFRQTAQGRKLVAEDTEEDDGGCRMAMCLAIARARNWQKLIDDGEIAGADEIAKRTGRDSSYVRRILRLSTLSPEIVHLIISGEYPPKLSLTVLTGAMPNDWDQQKEQFLTNLK